LATAPTESPRAPGFLAPTSRPVDLSRTRLPTPLRAPGTLTFLDITKYFGDATGGIRTYLLSKAEYVQAHPELRQILVIPGAVDAVADAQGVRCYRLRGPRIPFDRSYRFLLATRTTRRIFEHERPDLIEVGSPWLVPWVAAWGNRRLHAPFVWFYHTHFPAILDPGTRGAPAPRRLLAAASWRYVRRLAGLFRGILVASDHTARQLEAHGVERVYRVPLGVDLERFHPSRRAAVRETRRRFGIPEGPVALYLGRFAEEKQLETVLTAWREIERRTDAWLVLVGAGPREARLRAMAEGLQVRWVRYVHDRDQVADLLAAADLYVAPGPAETFGLSAIEAMAAGTPVLSVDQGGVAERIRASGAGLLYSPGDRLACAEAAVTLFRGDLRALGEIARTFAVRHHSWSTAFGEIMGTYRAILAKG
jgi:alpha-1,6-mannosyltransferase